MRTVRAVQVDKSEDVCCAALRIDVGTRAERHLTLFGEVGWCSKSSRCTNKGRGGDGGELHYEGFWGLSFGLVVGSKVNGLTRDIMKAMKTDVFYKL